MRDRFLVVVVGWGGCGGVEPGLGLVVEAEAAGEGMKVDAVVA